MIRHLLLLTCCVTLALSCVNRTLNADVQLVGGQEAKPHQFPAEIQFGACTAVKIGERSFLTAAHCIINEDEASPEVGLVEGASIRLRYGVRISSAQIYKVTLEKVLVHQDYVALAATLKGSGKKVIPTNAPDVAVFQTKEETPAIAAATLVADGPRVADPIVLTGYGCEGTFEQSEGAPVITSSESSAHQGRLKWAPSNIDALSPFHIRHFFETNALGDVTLRLCSGDSGGPLYVNDNPNSVPNHAYLKVVGINSYAGAGSSSFSRVDDYGKLKIATCLKAVLAGSYGNPRGGYHELCKAEVR